MGQTTLLLVICALRGCRSEERDSIPNTGSGFRCFVLCFSCFFSLAGGACCWQASALGWPGSAGYVWAAWPGWAESGWPVSAGCVWAVSGLAWLGLGLAGLWRWFFHLGSTWDPPGFHPGFLAAGLASLFSGWIAWSGHGWLAWSWLACLDMAGLPGLAWPGWLVCLAAWPGWASWLACLAWLAGLAGLHIKDYVKTVCFYI